MSAAERMASAVVVDDATSWASQWDSLLNSVPEESKESDSSDDETPVASSVTTIGHQMGKAHYYVDDREMPPWKIYAKELFLYGGPGLWRSASLKGSDPILLMAQTSLDGAINSNLRTGSLSGNKLLSALVQVLSTSWIITSLTKRPHIMCSLTLLASHMAATSTTPSSSFSSKLKH